MRFRLDDIPYLRAILSRVRPWQLIAAGLLIVVLLGAAGWFLVNQAMAANAPAQPIEFPHSRMVRVGVTCTYCHSAATKSPAAGMPTVERCMGCHTIIKPDAPEIKKLAVYWKEQAPIPWVRIYNLPRFVFFSHEVHVSGAKLACEKCHGDVGNMDYPTRKVVDMNMGWCLDCHSQQPNAPQLRDCVVCHR